MKMLWQTGKGGVPTLAMWSTHGHVMDQEHPSWVFQALNSEGSPCIWHCINDTKDVVFVVWIQLRLQR